MSGFAEPTLTRRQRAGRTPSALARAAGVGVHAGRSMDVEALEQRRLLFTLSVSPSDVDPATGLGTASAWFGYFGPSLFFEIPDEEDSDFVTEGFDDEDGFWTQFLPQIPPRGTVFNESNFQINYSGAGATPTRIPGPNPPDDNDDFDLAINLTGSGFVSFSFLTEPGDAGPSLRLARSAQFVIRDLDTNGVTGTEIELLLEGEVIETLSGNELTAISAPTPLGVLFNLTFPNGFDSVRFSSVQLPPDNITYVDQFVIESITTEYAPGRFSEIINGRALGVEVVLVGPAGASAQFLDLYGRDMRQTIAIGTTEQDDAPPIGDRNDDGVPDFNDGLGRIIVNGTNENSSLVMWGGTIETGPIDADTRFAENGFLFKLPTELGGLLGTIEEPVGFGYDLTDDDPPTVIGLPDAAGSIIVGAPFLRDITDDARYLQHPGQPVTDKPSFNRPDQGVRVNGSIGTLIVHGVMHGSSRITGAARVVSTGILLGSLSVDGDAQMISIASDFGHWVPDDQGTSTDPTPDEDNQIDTGNTITVGRTLGDLRIGGRSTGDVRVLGDLSNPNRVALSNYEYREKEVIYYRQTAGDNRETVENILSNPRAFNGAGLFGNPFLGSFGKAVPFGNVYVRNDQLLTAEFIGGGGTAARISGNLSNNDQVNGGLDSTDVFAFPASFDSTVTVDVEFRFANLQFNPTFGFEGTRAYARIVDHLGRTIASHEVPQFSDNRLTGLNPAVRFTFTPDATDIYYLVLNIPIDGDFSDGPTPYQASISGYKPTVFGSYMSAARTGLTGDPNSIVLQAGDMGAFRVGTGLANGGGGLASPAEYITTDEDDDDLLSWRPSTLSVAGNLYGAIFGSDVSGTRPGSPGQQMFVGGSLGSFRTGQNPIVGTGIDQGDVEDLTLEVGGGISVFHVNGAIRFDQDYNGVVDPSRTVSIRTGTSGGRGDIGLFNVGQSIDATSFNLRTSNNSIIDRFLVGETGGTGQIDEALGNFQLGAGSDIRFASFNSIGDQVDPDVLFTLLPGAPLSFTDDSGSTVRLSISGGLPTGDVPFAVVRVLPINGSQGVAIARIDATLTNGANLVIDAPNGGRVGIGRIAVTTSAGARSGILIGGTGEIDVYRIEQTAGLGLNLVRNSTPNGDIVALDVLSLDTLQIAGGSLGRTQVNSVGPRLIGPDLGVSIGFDGGGGAGAVGGPMGVNPAAFNEDLGGEVFPPVNPATSDFPGDVTLSDIGGVFDSTLNGAIVRTGSVASVTVNRSIGDFIMQGGDITEIIANADGITPANGFEGIVGTIYARNIINIDVGDGLVGPGDGSMPEAGIFAENDIDAVFGGRGLNPRINGLIIAANTIVEDANDGLVAVRIENGTIDGAYIASATLDSYWRSARFWYTVTDADDPTATGVIGRIQAVNTDIFRSELFAISINTVEVAGAWDASVAQAVLDIGTITADEFRNSTRLGEPLESRSNLIKATRNLNRLSTNGRAGDISDLTIDVEANVTGEISARNITRATIEVNNNLTNLFAVNDVRSSTIDAGQVSQLNAGADVRSSRISARGAIVSLTAGDNITSSVIESVGPNGRIDSIRARLFLTGDISSSGPINSIVSTSGDIIGSVTTTDAADGTLALLQAGGNMFTKLSIQSDVTRIVAGLNIGAVGDEGGERAINIRGNLDTIQATAGQIYTDLRVGGTLNSYRNARVVALPGNDLTSRASITSYGRINALNLFGDFNGSVTSYSGGIGAITLTDGSYRPDNSIRAFDGGIDSFTITGGHLQGNVYADETIGAIRVLPNALGFAGDIGVNPYLSQSVGFDPQRNQLPPGVAPNETFQGARIQSGTNIGLVEVAQANMWESAIIAGHSIGRVFIFGAVMNDTITPGLGGSFITAGDTIANIEINQFVGGAVIAAGVLSLGQDGRPGGTGANADIVQFGRIGDLIFKGGTGAVTVSAGMNAGPDGVYNTGDDEVADGISTIGSVTVVGAALETSVFADNGIGFTSPGIIRGGPGLNQANPGRIIEFVPATGLIAQGVPTPFTLPSGETGKITFTGPGNAYFEHVFDEAQGRVVGRLAIINSTLGSSLIVDSDQGSFTDLVITSNDSSSLGFASVRASLFGASQFYFDGYVQQAEFGYLDMTGVVGAGNDIGLLTVGPVVGGSTIFGNYVNSLIIGGDVGPGATVDFLAANSLLIGGNQAGRVTLDRDIASINILGRAGGGVRAGRSIGSFTAGDARDARVGAGNDIGSVRINGSADFSQFLAGTDLGKDTVYGGTGLNADRTSNGNLGPVTVAGSFRSSDAAAGITRGVDGFLGTSDDLVADGRSSVASVTIGGGQVGSQFNGQSFRVTSNGSVGPVTVAGQPAEAIGNFTVERLRPSNFPLQVADLRVIEESGLYTASIEFNQKINQATLSPALRISEIRAGGVFVQLAEGSDYFVEYQPDTNTAVVTFSRDVTQRSLPQQGGVPGPGVYRFELDAAIFRGQTQNALLDGNADGFAAGDADSWSQDDVVGDAGDKLVNNTATASFGGQTHTVDFYAATDLNQILDNNYTPDFLPDVNSEYTLRGTLGDHPDEDVNFFRAAGDADLYKVTLRAGQILKLGRMLGAASEAGRALLDAGGNQLLSSTSIFPTGNVTPQALRVASTVPDSDDLSLADNYLITQTGTYYILVTAGLGSVDVQDPDAIANIESVASALGRYSFTVEVFDDADTGFAGDTDSGDGVGVVNAPAPIAFTGPDRLLNTADDLAQVVVGQFTFTLNPGADNVKGTADDIVSGSNGSGITSQRTAGADNTFGTADDRIVSFIGASIGKPGFAGAPVEVSPDADVYRLNNGAPIAPGTRIRVTVQLTEFGSNIGLTPDARAQDLRGDVQLAVFETSTATNVTDAKLIAAPTDFKPIGQRPNQIVTNGTTSYGYNADGDFFMEFVTPGRLGVEGLSPASYAVYLQGAIRSDYSLEILTQGTGSVAPVAQNVYIELRGGTLDWLEAGENVRTRVSPFTVSGLGFTGFIGATPIDSYVSQNVLSRVQGIFDAAGLNVNVSTTTAGFEGSSFSTVFLSGSPEPTAFFFDGRFGYAQRSDPFNTDLSDQGVVFLPQLNTLGNPQSPAGIEALINQITNATVRRIGELMGVRSVNTAALTGQVFDVHDVNSVNAAFGFTLPISGIAAQLSIPADAATSTNFYLGQQQALPLLQKFIS